jgi:hypothetical protein
MQGFSMESYLIRIYRREKDNPEGIVGIIEEIGTERKYSFKNLSDLSKVITMPKRRRGRYIHKGENIKEE